MRRGEATPFSAVGGAAHALCICPAAIAEGLEGPAAASARGPVDPLPFQAGADDRDLSPERPPRNPPTAGTTPAAADPRIPTLQ